MSKIWLITGSARGLGRHLAEAVLAAGDSLVATARDTSKLSDLVSRYGDRIRPVSLDVTDAAAARAAAPAMPPSTARRVVARSVMVKILSCWRCSPKARRDAP